MVCALVPRRYKRFNNGNNDTTNNLIDAECRILTSTIYNYEPELDCVSSRARATIRHFIQNDLNKCSKKMNETKKRNKKRKITHSFSPAHTRTIK